VRPVEGHFSIVPIMVVLLCSYLVALRNLMIVRTDQAAESQLNTYLLAPVCLLWTMLVLRPLRLYAMITCAKSGWVTRAKVEVGIAQLGGAPPRPALPASSPYISAADLP
jgi:hyaluronan synthase